MKVVLPLMGQIQKLTSRYLGLEKYWILPLLSSIRLYMIARKQLNDQKQIHIITKKIIIKQRVHKIYKDFVTGA